MNKFVSIVASIFISAIAFSVSAQDLISSSLADARVYIIEPADGQVISGDVTVTFGLAGMGVAPAGVDAENTGHHHLLIDVADDAMPPFDQPLPANDNVKHFGKGQTQTVIQLEPGKHTLQLLLANHLHIPHDPPVLSEKITIEVK